MKLREYSGGNIKKSNLILGLLVLAFFIVLVGFLFDSTLYNSSTGLDIPQSSTIDIKSHLNTLISHFAGEKTCSQCHLDKINNDTICIDLCHKLGGIASGYIPIATWIGNGSAGTILFQHHPGGSLPFSCLTAECHEHPVEIDDARWAIPQDATHEYCNICHAFSGHGNGSGGMGGGGHEIHTTINSKGPDPPLDCGDCHDINDIPTFADGQNLENTMVCDGCHSPDGAYDGVAMAKDNWHSGVYDGDILQAGKEIWCASCHDDGTSQISGVTASNVAGDGMTYGYYVSGHGQGSLDFLCTDCHDTNITHIDGIDGTYEAPFVTNQEWWLYQEGYRLRLVNGEYPMSIPYRSGQTGEPVDPTHFRLCFDSGCHDSAPFMTNTSGNAFRDDNPPSGVPNNYHYMHLTSQHNPDLSGVGCSTYCHSAHGSIFSLPWDSDWDGAQDSDVTCTSCHNVHGSKSTNMMRTGEAHDIEPGLNFKYLDSLEGEPWNFKDPQTRDGSTGGAMDIPSVAPKPVAELEDNGICLMCHDQRVAYYRTWP